MLGGVREAKRPRSSSSGRNRWKPVVMSALPLGAIAMLVGASAMAQDVDPAIDEPSVWDLAIGAHASELLTDDFINYSCGTNGGPPSLPIADWTAYQTCRLDAATGLREVYFEYDDELELFFRSRGLLTQAAVYEFTSTYSRPIIASALFDDDGFMIMLRLVTDPRVATELRELAVTLSGFLFARFGAESWTCEDLPRIEGERRYNARYEKQRCQTTDAEGHAVMMETHHYRRPGQETHDARGVETTGQFWSETRLEVSLVGDVPDREARLAAIAERGDQGPSEFELLIARAMDCPGCDLSGVNLKRANLTGANLAGANLTGANLHGAILREANLTGAVLDEANLNAADVRLATLVGASMQRVLIYRAVFDGANLDQVNLNESAGGFVSLSRTSLVDAQMLAVDLRNARITDADLRGADLRFSWAHDATFIRSDLSGALLSDTVMPRANFSRTKLIDAELLSADLIDANLRAADLSGADFSYARLSFAIMVDIVAVGTIWTNAVLPTGFTPPN